jgi:hypothetical protein
MEDEVWDDEAEIDDLGETAKVAASIGTIIGGQGSIELTFIAEGVDGYLNLWATNPYDRRRAGILTSLGHKQYKALKGILKKCDSAIAKGNRAKRLAGVGITVEAGNVRSEAGCLCFSYVIDGASSYIRIDAYDPSDRRKSGCVTLLSEAEFESLKSLVSKVGDVTRALYEVDALRVPCERCNGTGKCPQCGEWTARDIIDIGRTNCGGGCDLFRRCGTCLGDGDADWVPCTTCSGWGFRTEESKCIHGKTERWECERCRELDDCRACRSEGGQRVKRQNGWGW